MTYFKSFLTTLSLIAMSNFASLPSAEAEMIEQYSIVKTESGFVRTNLTNGHTSLCKITNTSLICRASADEVRAFEQTNQELQSRIDRLEARLAELERKPNNRLDLTQSEDLDKAMDLMEGFMTRFFDMAKNLKLDNKG